MSVSRGFYRHYKGHVYYVHGVVCLKHESDRRIVAYTSVKTEEGNEAFDMLGRDEIDFEAWVDLSGNTVVAGQTSSVLEEFCKEQKLVRRFERIMCPSDSVIKPGNV